VIGVTCQAERSDWRCWRTSGAPPSLAANACDIGHGLIGAGDVGLRSERRSTSNGDVAERLRGGVQNRLPWFNSRRRLQRGSRPFAAQAEFAVELTRSNLGKAGRVSPRKRAHLARFSSHEPADPTTYRPRPRALRRNVSQLPTRQRTSIGSPSNHRRNPRQFRAMSPPNRSCRP
jgi:hypothetical protein